MRLCKLPPNPVGSKVKNKVVNKGKLSEGFVHDFCIKGNRVMIARVTHWTIHSLWTIGEEPEDSDPARTQKTHDFLNVRRLVSSESCQKKRPIF